MDCISHLFNQGVVSGQLLLEPPFRALCKNIADDGYGSIFDDDFPAEKTKITYAIISRTAEKLPNNLPFFSKQTLVNAINLLQKYRYNIEFLGGRAKTLRTGIIGSIRSGTKPPLPLLPPAPSARRAAT